MAGLLEISNGFVDQITAVPANTHVFNNEVIPITDAQSVAAVQALPVTADAEATVTGRIETETLLPAGTAKGEVTIINTIESPVPIPKGAEFIGKNANGEEVRFTLDADTVVPSAVTTSSISGNSTTYGQIAVSVTARSPGSASNVDANTITQVLIPGQQPIVSQNSNFIFQNAPIAGGSEQPPWIVTEGDVQAVLGQALTSLYSVGVQQLRAEIDETQAGIDATTIVPSATDLGDPSSYELPVVEPPVGQPVDPNNPVVKVTVRARFNALATPRGRLIGEQLAKVLPEHFDSPCKAGDTALFDYSDYRWDGQRLTVDSTITCT